MFSKSAGSKTAGCSIFVGMADIRPEEIERLCWASECNAERRVSIPLDILGVCLGCGWSMFEPTCNKYILLHCGPQVLCEIIRVVGRLVFVAWYCFVHTSAFLFTSRRLRFGVCVCHLFFEFRLFAAALHALRCVSVSSSSSSLKSIDLSLSSSSVDSPVHSMWSRILPDWEVWGSGAEAVCAVST